MYSRYNTYKLTAGVIEDGGLLLLLLLLSLPLVCIYMYVQFIPLSLILILVPVLSSLSLCDVCFFNVCVCRFFSSKGKCSDSNSNSIFSTYSIMVMPWHNTVIFLKWQEHLLLMLSAHSRARAPAHTHVPTDKIHVYGWMATCKHFLTHSQV